ncbi:MAG: hypothetical protein DHS20C17_11180 [Cyclobacteriaceae bacterium]|nr:MAG: hypothetical protein DHS20C17_11180 [Cyclobacteriaceae bacterium]
MSGCSSCGTGKTGAVSGCQNNGGCLTGGCNKLNVFDWLSNMGMPQSETFDIVEVRFKSGKKEFYRNQERFDVVTGDAVIVDVPNGHHMGYVSLQGELVRLQMQKKKIRNDQNVRKIYRKANVRDLEKYQEVRKRENPTLIRTRQIIKDMGLAMKLSDVEYQADNSKATFFYSADERVDFRELIKVLASEFKIRVEMRQISLRQEAGRLGGIGSCGRELCCATWLTDFKSVTTATARYQNLSLNPSKLSGQCGRLKCCLNFELDTYLGALTDIPKLKGPLLTKKGAAKLQKTDIFRKIMWFGYEKENSWHPVSSERVKEIIDLNSKNVIPETLELNEVNNGKSHFAAINKELERIDKKYRSKRRNKPRKKSRGRNNPNS